MRRIFLIIQSRQLQGLFLPIAMVLLWELSLRLSWLPASLIAPPSSVMSAFVALIKNGDLWLHTLVSVRRLAVGFSLGCVSGIIMGLAIGLSKQLERFFMPTFLLLAPIPIIAWIPLFIIVFGIDGARFAIVAFGSFFILLFGSVEGIRSTDDDLVDMARMYGKSQSELMKCVLFPSATPNIFQSLRTAMAMSWILLIMAEIIASSSGLGWLLWDSRNFGRSDDMIVAMITIGLLGKLADSFIVFLSKRALWWRKTFVGQ
ncbi:MAG: ABC transporter permease [Cyanobacteriota bacterium]